MKKNLLPVAVMLVCTLCICSCNTSSQNVAAHVSDNTSAIEASPMPTATPTPTATAIPTPSPTPVMREITLSFAGDCTFGTINECNGACYFPYVYEQSGSISYPFDMVKDIFSNDNLTIVNCEGALTEASNRANKRFFFKGPAKYAHIFSESSIEAVSISNNHAPLDYLKEGFEDTKKNLSDAGTGIFYEDTPYITEVDGIQVVIIGDSTVTEAVDEYTKGIADRVLKQITTYKKDNNIVIVNMHWGIEQQTIPTKWQQEAGRAFIDAGADLVIGQHSHIVQGIELYNRKYIVYSLGNFAFGGNTLCWHPETFIFRICFSFSDSTPTGAEACIVPCCCSSSSSANDKGILRNNYQPMPLKGEKGSQVIKLILNRSSSLKNGIKDIPVYDKLP